MLDVEAITQATATLRRLMAAGPGAWDGAPEEDVVAALGAAADLARVCDAVKIAAAGAVARRSEPLTPIESLARRLGHANTRRLVMEVFGVNGYVAGSWIEVAAAVQPRTGLSTGQLPPARPAVAAALEAGELSAEIAKAIVEQLSKLTGETVDGGIAVAEAAMVANATGGRINLFTPTPTHNPAPAPGAPTGPSDDPAPAEGLLRFPPQAPPTVPDSHERAGRPLGQQPQPSRASFRPVLPPSMDEHAARRGTGSAIAGGRAGLERIKEESKAWGLVLDPDGAEPRYEQQRKNRSFRLIKKATGGYEITGFAPDVEGAQIRTLLDAYLSPRTKNIGPDNPFNHHTTNPDTTSGPATPDPDTGGPGTAGPGASAERTHAQRCFDALAHILALHAASSTAPTTAGAPPTVLISTTLTALDHHLNDCATHHPHSTPTTDTGSEHGTGSDHGAAKATSPGTGTDTGSSTEVGTGTGIGASAGTGTGTGARLGGVGEGWWPRGIHEIPLNAHGVPDPEALIDLRFARVGGDGTPVPLTALTHLLCDAALQIMLTDPTGVPLKLGRAQRLFSKDQRRILIARDHHCQAPGCDIPAQWCEAHHITPWNHGGHTNITNAILLCTFHHHEIDRGRLKITHHPGPHTRFEHTYTVEPTWTPHQTHYQPTG